MTKSFKQLNHKTREMHLVVIHRDGHWHSYVPPMRRLKIHTTLEDFQKYFDCPDEELAIIKLKYGSPDPPCEHGHIQSTDPH